MKEKNTTKIHMVQKPVCEQKGITLVSLIIMMVLSLLLLLLIITSIAVEKKNIGIVSYAQKTKDEAEEVSKIEGIKESIILSKGASKTGKITIAVLQNSLDIVFGQDYAKAVDNGNIMIVIIDDKYYVVDSNGNVNEGKILYQVDI